MPLVDGPTTKFEHTILPSLPVISGPASHKPKLAATGKTVLNLASPNWVGLLEDERIKEVAIGTLRGYGLSPCGPPGFYGTLGKSINMGKPSFEVLILARICRRSHSARKRHCSLPRDRLGHRLLAIVLHHHFSHSCIRQTRRCRRGRQIGQLCHPEGSSDLSMHGQVVRAQRYG